MSDSLVGRRLGDYTCLELLGSGGMADVYLARKRGPEGFHKLFALKVISAKASRDPEFQRMFMREAKISATFTHPNIAQVTDFGQSGNDFYLVMEYVTGPSVQRVLKAQRGQPLPIETAISIAVNLCAALDHVHENTGPDGESRKLVHRDISPSNVLLTREGVVKLVDFGIAKPIDGPGRGTTTGVLKGKVGYMAPEQVRGEALDRRCDIFAVGILIYEMTTGRRCFFADSMFEVLNLSQRAEYTPPGEFVPGYPEALARIVSQALSRDREGRLATAALLQEALEEFALARRLKTSARVVSDLLTTAMPQEEALMQRRALAAGLPTEVSTQPHLDAVSDSGLEAETVDTVVSSQPTPARRTWVSVAATAAAGAAGFLLASGRTTPSALRPMLASASPVRPLVVVEPARGAEEPPVAEPNVVQAAAETRAPAPPTSAAAKPKPRKKRNRNPNRTKKKAGTRPADRDALLPPSTRQ